MTDNIAAASEQDPNNRGRWVAAALSAGIVGAGLFALANFGEGEGQTISATAEAQANEFDVTARYDRTNGPAKLLVNLVCANDETSGSLASGQSISLDNAVLPCKVTWALKNIQQINLFETGGGNTGQSRDGSTALPIESGFCDVNDFYIQNGEACYSASVSVWAEWQVQPTTTIEDSTTTLPDSTTSLPEPTTTIEDSTTTLPDSTTSLPESTTTIEDSTTTLPDSTTSSVQSATLPATE